MLPGWGSEGVDAAPHPGLGAAAVEEPSGTVGACGTGQHPGWGGGRELGRGRPIIPLVNPRLNYKRIIHVQPWPHL